MAITWDYWLLFLFFAVSAIEYMAEGIIRLRIAHGATWKAVAFCAIAMFFCVSGTLGMYFFYSSHGSMLETLKKPPGPSHLRSDWGADLSREDRTKYSQGLAQMSFQDWGITVNYIDETGSLRPYQPTNADRARLQWRRQAVAYYEKTTNLLKWVTLSWLFIPWLGLLAAFVPWSVRVLGVLTSRSKLGAPQSGSAPSS